MVVSHLKLSELLIAKFKLKSCKSNGKSCKKTSNRVKIYKSCSYGYIKNFKDAGSNHSGPGHSVGHQANLSGPLTKNPPLFRSGYEQVQDLTQNE